jgi:hypothetical protein
MLVSGIKSRPVYPGIEPDLYAKKNLFVCDCDGVAAVCDLARKAGAEFVARSTILLCGSPLEASAAKTLEGANVWTFPTIETALIRLGGVLGQARMGTRLYAAGSETLIGSVVKLAEAHGVDHRSVFTEHRGSTARRVQCVHCKGITDEVTTNPVKCAHCGLSLLVRDHYSRRIGAFMGVRIDAEAPGDIPQSMGEFK